MSLVWFNNDKGINQAETVRSTVRQVVKPGTRFHIQEAAFWLEIDGAYVVEQKPARRGEGYSEYMANCEKALTHSHIKRALGGFCTHLGGGWYQR
jgi:hypothetical protein